MLVISATLTIALFTGAALYITLVEHPARLTCSTATALEEWRPSYRRATVMQAILAGAGTLLCIAAWMSGDGGAWLAAGLLLGAAIAFTLTVLWPTNKRLEDPALDPSGEEARRLLERWGRLHAVRSALGLAALLLALLSRP
jgi:hypothetical protein